MKLINVIFMLIVSIGASASEFYKELNISFVKEMFYFSQSTSNTVSISTNKFLYSHDRDTSTPCLPLIPVDVKVPYGSTINNYNVDIEKELLYNDIVIAQNSQPTPDYIATDESANVVAPNYTQSRYPLQNVSYSSISNAEDSTILHFVVCPFVYESKAKRLYLINNIKLTINVNTDNTMSKLERQAAFINSRLPLLSQSSGVLSDYKISADSVTIQR